MGGKRTRYAGLAVVALLLALSATAEATSRNYVGFSQGVGRSETGGQTFMDTGALICQKNPSATNAGGACIPFDSTGVLNGILVVDDEEGTNVAFTVCVDNDRDNQCTVTDSNADCKDFIAKSHGDGDAWFNALGPLPTSRPTPGETNCPTSGGFDGYIVFICAGVHEEDNGEDVHTHNAVAGTISLVSAGAGPIQTGGEFCRPDPQPPEDELAQQPVAYVANFRYEEAIDDVPALSGVGLAVMALGIVTIGTFLHRRKKA